MLAWFVGQCSLAMPCLFDTFQRQGKLHERTSDRLSGEIRVEGAMLAQTSIIALPFVGDVV